MNDYDFTFTDDIVKYEGHIYDLINAADCKVSTMLPSEWAELNRTMTSDLSDVEGPFSYKNSPYTKELIDFLHPSCPHDTLYIMKGAQLGLSAGFIENGIGYIISENPGNTLLLVGHEGNLKDSLNKIEQVIDGGGIRHLIKSNIKRARNVKSGDTDKRKDFTGGYLRLDTTNHKSLRNFSMRNGFIDDFEAMKGSTQDAGSTVKMIEQRFAATKRKKLSFISSPELKEGSNIEHGYLKGDQRRYFIPCPCCNEEIVLEWDIPSEKDPDKIVGITWEKDDSGDLIVESMGYVCQKCDGFFDDRNKMDWLNKGRWIPTAKSSRPGLISYQISALYAPIFMDGWERYIRDFIDCTPEGRERNAEEEQEYKTFRNVGLGLTYEFSGKSVSANKIQRNARKYEIGIVPNKLSVEDGNGEIILLTCGIDLNGDEDDARVDYEIVAYSESGANYSITEGSIGTFKRRDGKNQNRERWTYKHGVKMSVWPILEKILTSKYVVDSGGKMRISGVGLDVGHMMNLAYQFSDQSNSKIICLKGSPTDSIKETGDYPTYRKSRESGRGNLYLVESNHVKDLLSYDMDLNWHAEFADKQPFGFMNFPQSSDGKYSYSDFFSHFEAETKIMDKTGKFVWKRIKENNHKYDCRLYAGVIRDIILDTFLKNSKILNGTWKDLATYIKKSKKAA